MLLTLDSTCRTADIDEKAIRSPVPKELVLSLAEAKATAILQKMRAAGEDTSSGFLLTCDQVSRCAPSTDGSCVGECSTAETLIVIVNENYAGHRRMQADS